MFILTLILNFVQIGNYYYSQGDFDLAHHYYQTAIEYGRTDPTIILKYGKTCYLLGDYQQAIETFSSLRSRASKRWLGLTYFQIENYLEATKSFQTVATDPTTKYYYAIALYNIGDYQSSLDLFDSLAEDFTTGEIEFWKSLILARQGKAKKAIELLDQIEPTGWWANSARYLDCYLRDQLNMPLCYAHGDEVLLLRARVEFSKGDIKKALSILDSISGYYQYRSIGMALCYLKFNWYNRVIGLLKSTSDTGWVGNYQHLLMGAAYLNLRNYRKARDNFQSLGVHGLEGIIWTYFKSGQYDSVLFYVKKMEEITPKAYDSQIHFLKAQSLFNLKKYQSVEPICREIIRSDPKTNFAQQAYLLMGEAVHANGNFDHARKIWSKFIRSYPASPIAGLAMKKIGDSYFHSKKYHSAIESYLKVRELPHTASIIEDADMKIELGRYKLGYYKTYTQMLKNYFRYHPDSPRAPEVGLEIGDRYRKAGYMKTAIKWYEKIRDNYPKFKTKALFRIAKVREMTNNISGLKKSYYTLIEINKFPRTIEQLARLYLSTEDYDSAIYWFEQLSHQQSHRNFAYYELAKIYRKLDKTKEAEFFLRPVVESESSYKTEASLELAAILRETGRFDEARRILSKLLDNPRTHLLMGEIEYLSGNYLAAKNQFIKACSLFGDNRDACAEAIIQAADAVLKTGDKKEALELYTRAELLASDPRIKIRATRKKENIK